MSTTKLNSNQLDSSVYTQSNLVAGTNISLTDELDTDALLLLHFDDNFNDSSSYNVEAKGYTGGGAETTLTGTFIDAKFGKGLKTTSVYARYYHNKKQLIASKKEATIEFWIKKVNITSSASMTCSSGNSLHWIISGDTLSFYCIPFTDDYYGKQDIDISSVNSDSFFHVAFTYKSGIITIYINGVSKWTRDFSTFWDYYFDASRIRDYVSILGAGTDDGVIDEFRFSDIARWTSNFTVQSAPYSVSTGIKKINSSNSVQSIDVKNMLALSQTAYDALTTKDPNTFYIIVEDGDESL